MRMPPEDQRVKVGTGLVVCCRRLSSVTLLRPPTTANCIHPTNSLLHTGQVPRTRPNAFRRSVAKPCPPASSPTTIWCPFLVAVSNKTSTRTGTRRGWNCSQGHLPYSARKRVYPQCFHRPKTTPTPMAHPTSPKPFVTPVTTHRCTDKAKNRRMKNGSDPV